MIKTPSGGQCVRMNPVTHKKKKTSFKQQQKKALEEAGAKQGLCKAEIKYKIVWVDKRGAEVEAERGRGKEPRKQPQWW